MSQNKIDSSSKKRNFQKFMVEDLSGKLRSKKDFYVYFDKHRK